MWCKTIGLIAVATLAGAVFLGGCDKVVEPEEDFQAASTELVGLWETVSLTIDGEQAPVYETPERTPLLGAARLHFDVLWQVSTLGPAGPDAQIQRAGVFDVDVDSLSVSFGWRDGQRTEEHRIRAHWLVVGDVLDIAFQVEATQVAMQLQRAVASDIRIRVEYYDYDRARTLAVEYTAAKAPGSCTDGPGCSLALWLPGGSYSSADVITTDCERWATKWSGLSFCPVPGGSRLRLKWWIYSPDGQTVDHHDWTNILFQ